MILDDGGDDHVIAFRLKSFKGYWCSFEPSNEEEELCLNL